jgi:hypothetical protein
VRDRLICGAAVAAVLGCLLTACTSGGQPTAKPAIPRGQLTPAQARSAFASWLASYKGAMFPYSATETNQLTTGLARQFSLMNQDPLHLGTSTVTDERVVVPIHAGYPRWFLGIATEPGPPQPTYLYFVLAQGTKGGQWQAVTFLSGQGPGPDTGLAKIAVDRDGYASEVPLHDTAAAVSPDQLSADYARLFNAGTQTAELSSVFPPGLLLFYIKDLQLMLAGARQHGWIDSATMAAGSQVYALKLRDGGAAVLFRCTQTVRYLAAHSTVLKVNLKDLFTPHGVPQPPYNLGSGVPIKAGTRLSLTDILQFLVLVGPRGSLPVHDWVADDSEVAFSPATKAGLR